MKATIAVSGSEPNANTAAPVIVATAAPAGADAAIPWKTTLLTESASFFKPLVGGFLLAESAIAHFNGCLYKKLNYKIVLQVNMHH